MIHAAFPSPKHNHTQCLEEAVQRAHALCDEQGIRLTKLRELILREIASSHTPLGAYDIIERMAKHGRRLAPISVYRIIDTLAGAGLVHKLESRNAYFACYTRHEKASPLLFFICNLCNTVAEITAPKVWRAIDKTSEAVKFTPHGSVLEINGVCAHCTPIEDDETR